MKIVNRQTFMSLPENTVYSNYEPCNFGPLSIKQESIRDIDFYTMAINDAILSDSSEQFVDILTIAEKEGSSIKLDFECCGRDGLFEEDQLFAVWEDDDIVQLIKRLLCCIKNGPKKETLVAQNTVNQQPLNAPATPSGQATLPEAGNVV